MSARLPDLYTASQVASFCGVDLKTIHMWCSRGELRFFRTPGRHLRFKQADVVEFLRKYGYPVPDALLAGRAPRVYVLDDDTAWLKLAQRALAKSFTVTVFDDPYDGIIAVGADVPDAVVLDVKLSALDGYHCVARLRVRHPNAPRVASPYSRLSSMHR